jgi:hypothetical protein
MKLLNELFNKKSDFYITKSTGWICNIEIKQGDVTFVQKISIRDCLYTDEPFSSTYKIESAMSKASRRISYWEDQTLIEVSPNYWISTASVKYIKITDIQIFNVTFNFKTGEIIKVEDYDKV